VAQRRAAGERLAFLSDAIFAVVITILVLDLKPPERPTLAALLPLWPTVLSYVVSYLFIAIVWVNHHHLMRFSEFPAPRLIWINFAHLFMVSLVPFSTAWVAATRFAAVPVSLYAAVFVLVHLAYLPFEWHALGQAKDAEVSARTRRIVKVRSFSTLGTFLAAILVSLKCPPGGFGLVCCALLLYLWPEPSRDWGEKAGNVASSSALPSQGELDVRSTCRSETQFRSIVQSRQRGSEETRRNEGARGPRPRRTPQRCNRRPATLLPRVTRVAVEEAAMNVQIGRRGIHP
jgi:uncharacterized membrane protein